MASTPPAELSAVDDTVTKTAQSFTLFPKLAPELKDMVWEFSLPGPRMITIAGDFSNEATLANHISWHHDPSFKINANTISTSLLQTCSRSRQIALRHYEPAFDRRFKHPIYFDWKRDTIVIKGGGLLTFDALMGMPSENVTYPKDVQDWRPKIRRMAICSPSIHNLMQRSANKWLADFKSLSTMIWVVPQFLHGGVQIAWETRFREIFKAEWKKYMKAGDKTTFPDVEFLTKEEMEAKLSVQTVCSKHSNFRRSCNLLG